MMWSKSRSIKTTISLSILCLSITLAGCSTSAWIHDHLAGANRMIVWAHIADMTNYFEDGGVPAGSVNMGHLLRQHFGSGYLSVGMSLYGGSYTVIIGSTLPLHANAQPIPAVDPNSYNATLGAVGLSLYMIDLRTVPLGKVMRWANGYNPFLNLGYDGTDLTTNGPLSQWFNIIIHMQSTTPTHIISNAVVTAS